MTPGLAIAVALLAEAAPVSTAPPLDPQACIAQARKGLAMGPRVVERTGSETFATLRACVKSLLAAGDGTGARTVAKAGNEIFPAEPQSGFDYGAVLLLTDGDLDEASTVLQQSLTRKGHLTRPSAAEQALAVNNLGRIALAKGQIATARVRFREALRLDPSYAGILYNLAAADQSAGDSAACFVDIKNALAQAPTLASRDDYLVAAWAHLETQHAAELAILLRTAIAKFPNASGLHLNFGRALAATNRAVQAAFEYYYEFMNDAADDPFAEEARGALRTLTSPPGSPAPAVRDALASVAAALSEEDADRDRVLPSLDTLEASGYTHTVPVFLRARALYRAGLKAEAEAAFRKCIARDPAFLPPYYDLSVLLRETGKEPEARTLVSEAVRRNPAHWELTEDHAQPAPAAPTPPQ